MPTMQPLSQQRAISLIEVLIVTAILAILAVIAIPSLFSLTQSNRVKSTANELMSSLAYAKSEAIKRGFTVSVCPLDAADATRCGDDWANGWVVFTNQTESANVTDADARLSVNDKDRSGALTIAFTDAANLVSFQSSGFPDPGVGTFTIRPSADCTSDNVRTLAISVTGRMQIATQACP